MGETSGGLLCKKRPWSLWAKEGRPWGGGRLKQTEENGSLLGIQDELESREQLEGT